MAKQRPSLAVAATPVSTYVNPGTVPIAGVELYDEQTVRLAQEFSEAFKDLSISAAGLAAGLKKQKNVEDIEAGKTMILQSQKSYQQLVQSGQIKPSENPWMAIGAQEASGTVQALKARSQFMALYEEKSRSDPKFFESADSFNALASSYAQEMNNVMGDASYMTRAFYDSFNPFVASMAMRHEENVVKDREQKIEIGVGASVAQAVLDLQSPDPSVKDTALSVLQEQIDTYSRQGMSPDQINDVLEDNILAAWAQTDQPELVASIWNGMKSGTGRLADTQRAKAKFAKMRAAIQANTNKMTHEESINFDNWIGSDFIPVVLRGNLSEQQARDMLNGYFTGPDKKITVSAESMEAKKGYALRRLEEARNEEARQLQKKVRTTLDDALTLAIDEPDMEAARKQFMGTVEGLGLDSGAKRELESEFESAYNKNAERRASIALQQREEILWNGVAGTGELGTTGLRSAASAQFAAYFAQNRLPDLQDFKGEIDSFLIDAGVSPETDKAKTVYRNAYSQFDSLLSAQIQSIANEKFQGNLMPVANEPTDVRRAKADLRGKAAMLRLRMGITFNDTRASTEIVGRAMAAMNPAAAEKGTFDTWPVEDLVNAYNNAIQTAQPIDGILPSGPYGDALKESLALAANRMRAGENPEDSIRDLVSGQFFGTTMRVEKAALASNPLLAGHYVTGNGQHAEDYQMTVGMVLEQGAITNPDTAPYVAAVFSQEVQKAIMQPPHNPRVAHEAAREAVMNNHIFIRGSMVPKHPDFGEFIDEDRLGAWLMTKYPDNEDATLVVVTVDANGTPVMAVRDAQGNALVPADAEERVPALYTPKDIVGDYQDIVSALPEYMAMRGFREQVREPLFKATREAVSQPGLAPFRFGEVLRGAVQAAARKPRQDQQ